MLDQAILPSSLAFLDFLLLRTPHRRRSRFPQFLHGLEPSEILPYGKRLLGWLASGYRQLLKWFYY